MTAALPAGEVHLWWAFADPATACEWAGLLDAGEHARAARIATPAGRREQVVGRALARLTLSRYAPVPPAAWRFVAGPWGKPAVDVTAGLPARPFNVSHGGGVVVCAVGGAGRVGCDVEAPDPHRAGRALAGTAFTAPELAGLRGLDEAERCRRFFRLWTLKEAYLKGRGFGLQVPLTDVQIRLDGPGSPALELAGPPDIPGRDWHLSDHQIGGRLAAVAADAPTGTAVCVRVFAARSPSGSLPALEVGQEVLPPLRAEDAVGVVAQVGTGALVRGGVAEVRAGQAERGRGRAEP